MDFKQHLIRQVAFSRRTFGPYERTAGVSDHIRKELVEISKEAEPLARSLEWTDVVILGLDGMWRALAAAHPNASDDELAVFILRLIAKKQEKNEGRTWPDWKTSPPDKAIEHDRKVPGPTTIAVIDPGHTMPMPVVTREQLAAVSARIISTPPPSVDPLATIERDSFAPSPAIINPTRPIENEGYAHVLAGLLPPTETKE